MDKFNCLIVDDEPELSETLRIDLRRNMNILCQSTETLHGAKTLLGTNHYDLCITDMALNPPTGREGLELVQYIQERYPNITTIVITAFGDMDNAIQAFRHGAFDYITKPLDFDALHKVIKKALSKSHTQSINLPKIIGTSKPIQHLREQIKTIARSEASIYITGESGSGKELVARTIHYHSSRNSQAFIPINCGAIPGELVESELFGHLKGSFTNAHTDRKGLFEEARGGTLFLDEISELPLNMQVKLLRALQEKCIRPVGANKEIPTDVRIICATHRNLLDLVNAGQFREDLYFRIRVFELYVPPLRERPEDIELLAKHIVARLRPYQQYTLTSRALNKLETYHYRGNVRELENVIEAALTLCKNHTIKPRDIVFIESATQNNTQAAEEEEVEEESKIVPEMEKIEQESDKSPLTSVETQPEFDDIAVEKVEHLLNLKTVKEKAECQKMLTALQKSGWNKTQAAKLLNMSWGQFRHRFDKYGLNTVKINLNLS